MAPLQDFSPKKVLVLTFVLLFMASVCISVSSEVQSHKNGIFGRRKLLDSGVELEEDEVEPVVKKKVSTSSSSSSVLSKDSKPKNQTKLLKSSTLSSSKNQTKLIKTSIGLSTKNQTKLTKTSNGGSSSTKDHTKLIKLPYESAKNKTKLTKVSPDSSFQDQPTMKTKLKKLNSTSKATDSTKTASLITKKSPDLTKSSSAKNKTEKSTSSKKSKFLQDEDSVNSNESKPKSSSSSDKKSKPEKNNKPSEENPKSGGKSSGKQSWPSWVDQDEEDDDLVSDFRGLPSKFQETLLPDLEQISKTSKVYLTKANKEITKGFKPYVGNKYAPTIASFISFAFIIVPLVLVSLIFNKIKAYFSLQKILIFIQIYLSIYFSILCLSSLITGLEPLKFFYATSQSTYVCLQVLQTLAYVLYLLLLLMYLILVFSTETGLTTKLLGLGQTFVGYAVGLHYYVTVFHMAVLHQPPKTSWKIHGIYATCFLLICVLTRVDYRGKKEYLDGNESKMS